MPYMARKRNILFGNISGQVLYIYDLSKVKKKTHTNTKRNNFTVIVWKHRFPAIICFFNETSVICFTNVRKNSQCTRLDFETYDKVLNRLVGTIGCWVFLAFIIYRHRTCVTCFANAMLSDYSMMFKSSLFLEQYTYIIFCSASGG